MMDTIICPKCGTENPASAMNCKNCRINLKFALERPDEIERIKQEAIQREPGPSTSVMSDYVPCPRCGSSNIKKITYTWWGGALGPRLLNHAKCNACGATYNGKTGQSNTTAIVIYSIVALIIAVVILMMLQA